MIRPYHLKKGQHPYWIRTIRTMWYVWTHISLEYVILYVYLRASCDGNLVIITFIFYRYTVISWLLPLFTLIWKYCVIPTDWNLAIILPLWKGKGSKSDCTKYRGISLLSVPAKVFAHIDSMSRTYEENTLCEAAAATERLYPWPIHT